MSKNRWHGIKRELARIREIAVGVIIHGKPEPPGWDWNRFRERRDWLERKRDDHEKGRMNAIMGGPEQASAMNAILFEMTESRQAGAIPEDRDGS